MDQAQSKGSLKEAPACYYGTAIEFPWLKTGPP
eukprot:CAMPEP_0181272986 /NCGR_PEP_ID=MMETSP1097-20121128/8355_1 /TAXON_ID=35684 /ORGANISM="Pseudopedinella elastica, Strain CCMP716" /LENGTH=32 /DNA_ID= /DNA_START= /DNA_END= /DNA_ORIENTATION=